MTRLGNFLVWCVLLGSGAATAYASCQPAYDGIIMDAAAVPAPSDMLAPIDRAFAAGVEKIILYPPHYSYAATYPDLTGIERARPDAVSLAVNISRAPAPEGLYDLDRLQPDPATPGPLLASSGAGREVQAYLETHPDGVYALAPDWIDPGDDCQSDAFKAFEDLVYRHDRRIVVASMARTLKDWETYTDRMARIRLLLGQLPADLAEDLAYRNAEWFYGVPATPP